ncbi:MAG: MBL fold metallo-hydrolase [Methylotenera sp. 24-45-7]|jgi:phosphoribosyl 1,2-cyclic phosphodiesterase|nr:MAG: MBL fold metallo-hydrolase [Mehylophilales bacterium 35-46-6]OYZ41933.1 MAG: MBL fold metallo-hydrolase [Methylotenera sp. 24-45-7]OZA07832.1 MAG: MBL fold metallo-hydrolase [Methylotenera sp. 17-45-7]HQS37394.1 MBL fold metallo-hydrolase [Methylotenera sp.]HQS44309.1 MBL fold metallo-hydrolase [Methylotenera sp.]
MRFASLGSGSAGNALVVEVNQTRVMLDCGFGLKETQQRLARLQLEPSDINGIVITHEHDDHASGAFKFAAKYNIPLWLTYGTLKMASRYFPNQHALQLNVVDSHSTFAIRDVEVQPFPVPHDAREPIQCVFSDGARALGVLTDVGRTTPHIEQKLNGCSALVLECNHDVTMLQNGPYAWSLKKRVGGELGHLDNQDSAQLLSKLDRSKLQHVLAAHLSAKNNTPLLAQTALAQVLACDVSWVGVADQLQGFDWRVIA